MIFLALTDAGIDTAPIIASDLPGAAEIVKQRYGGGLNGDGATPINVAVLLPQLVGVVTPSANGATLSMSGDAQTQATIRNNAQQALSNNQTYLGLANPTNAQVVAQVAALTRQVDALIRLAVGNFTGTN